MDASGEKPRHREGTLRGVCGRLRTAQEGCPIALGNFPRWRPNAPPLPEQQQHQQRDRPQPDDDTGNGECSDLRGEVLRDADR